jgi:hypothetical protein
MKAQELKKVICTGGQIDLNCHAKRDGAKQSLSLVPP